jgi:hypothetical protein
MADVGIALSQQECQQMAAAEHMATDGSGQRAMIRL